MTTPRPEGRGFRSSRAGFPVSLATASGRTRSPAGGMTSPVGALQVSAGSPRIRAGERPLRTERDLPAWHRSRVRSSQPISDRNMPAQLDSESIRPHHSTAQHTTQRWDRAALRCRAARLHYPRTVRHRRSATLRRRMPGLRACQVVASLRGRPLVAMRTCSRRWCGYRQPVTAGSSGSRTEKGRVAHGNPATTAAPGSGRP